MTAISPIIPLDADQTKIAAALQTAAVAQATEGGVMVQRQGRQIFARVALNCLVSPEPGDTVLIADADECWVIAILARAGNAPMQLLASGDLLIGATGSLSLHAETLNFRAAKANLLLAEILHLGRHITAHVPSLKLIGGVIETLAERVLLRAKWSQRVIEKADISQSGTIDQSAAGSFTLQAENAFITAGNAVRVDAGQIHMG
jgi:hypothetical protein